MEERMGFGRVNLNQPPPRLYNGPKETDDTRHQEHGSISRNSKTKECDNNLGVIKDNKSKRKRQRRRESKVKEIKLKLLGNNVDGVLNKLESLESIIKTENPGAIFLQETKVGRTGRIRIPSNKSYSWYELARTESAEKGARGGGLAIGVLNDLEPSWINEGDNEAEALTIEIWIGGFPIRLICGYGPQEGDKIERKLKFWEYMNSEVQKAKINGAKVFIQMDGNMWAGAEMVEGDPKPLNRNGKMLQDFLQGNPHLNVTNALPICEGRSTRVRQMKNNTQESILDFFFYCL